MEHMDKPPKAAISKEEAIQLADEIKKDKLIKGRCYTLWSNDNCFIGNEVVQWLIETGKAKDAEQAVSVGQSLLDHRLAHHVTDDYPFKNESLSYKFYSDESIEIQQEANLFDEREKNAKLAGYLKLRSEYYFSAPTFFECYALLVYDNKQQNQTSASNDASAPSASASATATNAPQASASDKQNEGGVFSSIVGGISSVFGYGTEEVGDKATPGVLYVYKLRSAPTPVLKLQVQNCTCSMTECVNCLADNYCFTITTNEIDSSKNQKFTLCAKNSKQAEAWMFAMQGGGLQFEKVDEGEVRATSLFELSGNELISNEQVPLEKFKGKVCLVVNVSSKCGLTPRDYPQLVDLHKKYGNQGLEILAFPCNQFAGQEPGTPEEIRKFIDGYGVEFPVFSKIDVNGSNAHPVFKFLKQNLGGVLGSSVKWNFTKFLCDKDGQPFRRYAPITTPSSFTDDIEFLLSKPSAKEDENQEVQRTQIK